MADKKVERSGRERPLTPTQKLKASLSDAGTVNMADPARDRGKAALVDKFREREERWRREQALRAQETTGLEQGAGQVLEDESPDEPPDEPSQDESSQDESSQDEPPEEEPREDEPELLNTSDRMEGGSL